MSDCYSIYYSRQSAPNAICHSYVYAESIESAKKKHQSFYEDKITYKQVVHHKDKSRVAPGYNA